MKIIAHRGFRKNYPENTIPAFVDAFRIGSDAVELDVHFTKDKKIVVFHDFNLKRLLGVDAEINDLDLDTIKRYRFPGTDIAVPTLDEVLSELGEKQIFIELKTVRDNGTPCYPDLPARVLELVNDHGASDTAKIISFNPLSIERIRELSSKIEIGLDVSSDSLNYFSIGDLQEFIDRQHIDHLLPEYTLLKGHKMHDIHGTKISPWTVNDPSEISAINVELYGIVTDNPDKFLKK
ncbi:MAG: glycerophosphodiester phosphodiesterase [Thermoplasmatales archaeon]|nr:glycerophosphodiester phosphodiesterase [Thermoplasmatales archaeon]MCW6169982.1 glycerophosphodiester phosphodiesterase [Thermoplasmatales archaeon]